MRMRLLVLFVTLVTAAGCGPDNASPAQGGATPTVVSTYTSPAAPPTTAGSAMASPTPAAATTPPVPAATTAGSGSGDGQAGGACGADYYRNVDGNCVHRPVPGGDSPPAGATAKCNDGTYSFSQHRSGTCSHHG